MLPEEGSETGSVLEEERELKLAITGRPNVGKSTLLNALVGEERAVVSPIAGTTRDAVDTVLPASNLFGDIFTRWRTVRVVDTAGIRRRGSIDRSIEGWSVLRSYDAIDAADVTLLLLDATEGLVHQDTQVMQRVVDAGKPLVLIINKWDLILKEKDIIAGTEEDDAAQEAFLDDLRRKLQFISWVQVLFLSAATGLHVKVIGKLVNNAYVAWSKVIDQDELDELAKEIKKFPRLNNLKKITFEHSQPPVFHIHTEGKAAPHFSTRRYVENVLRDYFELGPTPIKIWSETEGKYKKHPGK
jgi:GTP-binding protein